VGTRYTEADLSGFNRKTDSEGEIFVLFVKIRMGNPARELQQMQNVLFYTVCIVSLVVKHSTNVI
jgi:hypothetical protein